MKKATFFFCLLMAHSFLFGQKLPDNTQVKWGQEQKFNKKMTLTEFAASDETGHYILKRKLLEEMRGSAKLPRNLARAKGWKTHFFNWIKYFSKKTELLPL